MTVGPNSTRSARAVERLALVALVLAVCLIGARPAAAADPPGGVLRDSALALLWSGSLAPTGPVEAGVPECAMVACDRYELTVQLPAGVWKRARGGVQVAIRWARFGENLHLLVYRDGERVASSVGIIALAQSVLIPELENGRYQVYVAHDPDSIGEVVDYEGLAEVEYAPRPQPARRLLPDLTVRPQRHLTFETPPGIFFERAPEPPESCYASERVEHGAQICLRFDQVIANVGEGALELRYVLPHDPTSNEKTVLQRIYRSESPGALEERPGGEWEFHPVHDHYHFTGLALSRLWRATARGKRVGTAALVSSRKVGICVADIEIDAWARKGDGPRSYHLPDCFFPARSDADADYLVQGITPGWTDVYEWFVPDQYVNVAGLPDGLYVLDTIADPDNTLLEEDETNNCASVLVRLSGMAAGSPHAEHAGAGPDC